MKSNHASARRPVTAEGVAGDWREERNQLGKRALNCVYRATLATTAFPSEPRVRTAQIRTATERCTDSAAPLGLWSSGRGKPGLTPGSTFCRASGTGAGSRGVLSDPESVRESPKLDDSSFEPIHRCRGRYRNRDRTTAGLDSDSDSDPDTETALPVLVDVRTVADHCSGSPSGRVGVRVRSSEALGEGTRVLRVSA